MADLLVAVAASSAGTEGDLCSSANQRSSNMAL